MLHCGRQTLFDLCFSRFLALFVFAITGFLTARRKADTRIRSPDVPYFSDLYKNEYVVSKVPKK